MIYYKFKKIWKSGKKFQIWNSGKDLEILNKIWKSGNLEKS